jgi:hypothetical protein
MKRSSLALMSCIAAIFTLATAGQAIAVPLVTWTVPKNGDTVSGVINEKNGKGRVAVSPAPKRVDFYVDGQHSNTEFYAPYSLVWDTRMVPDGQHTLRAIARLADGSTGSAQITVRVDNTTPPPPSPPPPTGPGYPSIPDAQADRDGDFDGSCSLFSGDGGWQTNNIGSDYPGNGEIDRSRVAEGNCSAHLWAGNSGRHRTEVAFPPISNPDVVFEELFYVASGSGYLGYLNQFKEGGSGGGCSNSGLSNRSGSQLEVTTRASCSAEKRRIPIGTYPRDRWWAVKIALRHGNNGSIAAWVDPDGPGPAAYQQRLAPTTADTQSGDSAVKFRQGSYGDQNVNLWIDGFRLN